MKQVEVTLRRKDGDIVKKVVKTGGSAKIAAKALANESGCELVDFSVKLNNT